MSAKELTKLTLTDLWKEINSFEDFWQKEEDAANEFRSVTSHIILTKILTLY